MALMRPPRLVRMLAPVCLFAGVACLAHAWDIGAPQPLNLGGGQFFIPEPAIAGRPLAVVLSAEPSLLNAGWILLGMSAVLWLWDAATSP
jgi:hypothetical protein